jgi:hypothetical protein
MARLYWRVSLRLGRFEQLKKLLYDPLGVDHHLVNPLA